jgi:hypothetical protein
LAHQPQEPYVFQSGKHVGQCLEILMFKDYSFLNWQLGKIRESYKGNEKNKLHEHLEWLLTQGGNRSVSMICPHCNQRPIKWISVSGNNYGYSMDLYYTCCDSEECRDQLRAWSDDRNTFLEIKFSQILRFNHKQDQKQFAELLRAIFSTPKRLTREWSFEFFSS